MYELLLTREAQQAYEQADVSLVKKLNRCFERLRENPYQHSNIKRLKGSLAGCYRYRLGDWRVVYRVEEDGRIVVILLISHRRDAYR
ncbi:MAG: type II toxin-antitoxin system RelE/ParE family toxin [Chloroflexia bacterium]|nr:type II toxin-antitoxin system RelE/ParE family toxin [Chloroflexia bacterium]